MRRDATLTFIRLGAVARRVREADAFDGVAFLGLARNSKRDPYRLGLFARHLESDERPRALLAVRGGTLVVTDRRLLEFRAHLEVHGAWNVKEFQGYEVRRQWDRSAIRGLEHRVETVANPDAVEDVVLLELATGTEPIVVSRGPEATLSPEDFGLLRSAVLNQAK